MPQTSLKIKFPTNGRLRTKDEYIQRCLLISDYLLSHYGSLYEITRHEAEINSYLNL